MFRPSDSQAAALLDHVFSQTLRNIEFLASHNYISPVDATELSNRLTAAQHNNGDAVSALASSVQALTVPPVPPVGPGRGIPLPPPRPVKQARAVWAYNEDGREPNDLTFSTGEIIEIVDETNADWWTGKCRGKQGLFPSNHVEMIASPPASVPPPAAPSPAPVYSPPPQPMMPPQPMPPQQGYAPGYDQKPVYRPFGAVYQAQNQPPPAAVGQVNTLGLQQAPQQTPQQAPQQEQKKHRFGRLGDTMATSAAGGVGFGAGAAIGSGIVNAIF
ncbi:uncharacterized protein PHACADRAFT_251707 [Phanerochaete carnosa HHB-10118-sp]|uniref:SH3 domain-containing protein n=1 Tax=Phanerochaete carnosa (strain HHB-10118-sp) TaxID=650164 RepID=K5WFK3_PHACS|nr:uncharacterized protein PHACADRAFT_251707 [Phanerochaete carnosa HHB-10118-sp]EKM57834.1 hypothetical protein PHACADRAFT_251707 [Phanerochaete carnosa HHB-10118-sp]